MEEHIINLVRNFLQNVAGITVHCSNYIDMFVVLLVIAVLAILLDLLIQRGIMPLIYHFVQYTDTKWDDMLFDAKVIMYFSKLLPLALVQVLLPLAFPEGSLVLFWLEKIFSIIFVLVVVKLICAACDVTEDFLEENSSLEGKPYNLGFQVVKILVFLAGLIFIVSIFIDKSPAVLLTGLGASAAVLTLVFKDTIVGFVSGVQLSANDMLRVGDWVQLPSHNVNGYVVEIKLHTVKVQNFDMSVVTIPPANLISSTFTNWRNMQEKGARRICRSVCLDISSIKFCDAELLNRLRAFELLSPMLDSISKNGGKMPDGSRPTNVGLLRAYLLAFIEAFPLSCIDHSDKFFHMVRQLEPTPHGLPLEVYFFVKEVRWTEFERVQSDVFDQIFAAIPQFDLKVFQDIHN